MRGGYTLYFCVAASHFIFFWEVIKVNAKKCDRCGTFYEGDNGYQKVGELRLIKTLEYRDEYLDLCPHCKLSFNGWFKYHIEFIHNQDD